MCKQFNYMFRGKEIFENFTCYSANLSLKEPLLYVAVKAFYVDLLHLCL